MKQVPGDIIILRMCTINENHKMYGSWEMECDRQNFCHFGSFYALLPHEQPEKWKFWKNWKKEPENIIIWVPQMAIIWSMVPKISRAADLIFCHFVPFFPLLPF